MLFMNSGMFGTISNKGTKFWTYELVQEPRNCLESAWISGPFSCLLSIFQEHRNLFNNWGMVFRNSQYVSTKETFAGTLKPFFVFWKPFNFPVFFPEELFWEHRTVSREAGIFCKISRHFKCVFFPRNVLTCLRKQELYFRNLIK